MTPPESNEQATRSVHPEGSLARRALDNPWLMLLMLFGVRLFDDREDRRHDPGAGVDRDRLRVLFRSGVVVLAANCGGAGVTGEVGWPIDSKSSTPRKHSLT
jgi:hypothetical protein